MFKKFLNMNYDGPFLKKWNQNQVFKVSYFCTWCTCEWMKYSLVKEIIEQKKIVVQYKWIYVGRIQIKSNSCYKTFEWKWYFLSIKKTMRANEAHQHKCQNAYKKHGDAEMLRLSKHVLGFMSTLPNAKNQRKIPGLKSFSWI